MPASSGAARRPRRRRRRIWSIVLLALAGVYLVREPLFGGWLGRFAAARLSATLGCPVTIARVGGSWFGGLTLTDVHVGEPGTGALRRADIARIEVGWRAWRLLRDPLAAVSAATLRDGDLVLRLPAPAGGGGGPPPDPFALLARLPTPLPRLDVDLRVRVETPAGTLAIDHLRVAGAGGDARLTLAGLVGTGRLTPLATRQAVFVLDLDRGGLVVASDDAIAGVTLRRVTMLAATRRAAVEVGIADGTLTGGFGGNRAELALRGLDCARVPAWMRQATAWRLPTAGTLAGDATADRDADGWAFAGSLRADALAWPELAIDTARVEAAWRGQRLDLRRARVSGIGIELDAADLAWDRRAPLRLEHLGRLAIDVADAGLLARRFAPAVGARLPTIPIALALRAAQDADGRLRLDDARIACGDAGLVASGDVGLPPDLARWRESSLALRLDAAAPALAPLLAPGLGPGWSGAATVRAELGGTPAAPRGTLTATARGLVLGGRTLADVRLDVAADWPRIDLRELSIGGGIVRAAARGGYDLVAGTLDGATIAADAADLARLDPRLAGAAALDLSWHGPLPRRLADVAAATAAVRLRGDALGFAGHRVGAIEARAELVGGLLRVDRIVLDGGIGTIDVAGRATVTDDGVDATVARLLWRAGAPVARLERPLRLRVDGAGVAIENAEFTVGDGRLRLAALIGDEVSCRLALDGVAPGPWLARAGIGPPVEGRLTATIDVAGPRAAPDVVAEIVGDGLRIDGREALLTLSLTQDAQGLALRGLHAAWGAAQAQAAGTWPVRFGPGGMVGGGTLPANLRLRARAPELADLHPSLPFAGALAVELSAEQPAGEAMPRARLAVEGRRLRARADPTARGVELAKLVDATLSVSTAADAASAELTIAADGARRALFSLRLSPAPDWPSRPVALLDAPLAGRLTLDGFPLDRLSPWLPGLVRLAGAAGGDLALAGTARAPTAEGALALSGVALRLRAPLGAIADGEGVLRVTPGRYVLERFACRMGGEPAAVVGEVRDGALGREVDLRLTGERALLVQTADLRLRGDVDATLKGPLAEPLLAGRVAITSGLYSRQMELVGGRGPGVGDDRFQLFSLRDTPAARMRFDLRVVAPETLRIENNLLRAGLAVDLALGGTGESPAPVGSIATREASLRLPFSTLRVDHADLRFPADDPFRPRLEATGSSSFAAGAGARTIEVQVHVSGPIDQLEITTAGEGSEEDRLSLLTTGRTRSAIEADVGATAIGLAGGYLFHEVKRWASGPGDPDADAGFLDRFDLRLGDEVSRSGQEVIRSEFRLDDRDPARDAKEHPNQHWYAAAERDRFDELNSGIVWRLRFR